MLNIPTDYIIERIKESKGLSEADIRKRINEKLEALAGLISEQGAAHIIANELGVKLVQDQGQRTMIKNLLPGAKNVDVVGKVINVYEKKTFQARNGGQGQLGSFFMGDESGRIRVVLWGANADMLDKLEAGTIVKCIGAYTKENPGFNGSAPRVELHMGDSAKLVINPEGETVNIDTTAGFGQRQQAAERKNIADLKSTDDNVEILGTVVQAFGTNFFEVCPSCNKRVKPGADGYSCDTHGKITPAYSYVTNVVLDDGSETIRCVFFKGQTQHLFNRTDDELQELRGASTESIKTELLGKIIKLTGRVTQNAMFNRLEFVTKTVEANPNPQEELERITTKQKEEPAKTHTSKPEVKPNDDDEDEKDVLSIDDIDEEDISEDIYE